MTDGAVYLEDVFQFSIGVTQLVFMCVACFTPDTAIRVPSGLVWVSFDLSGPRKVPWSAASTDTRNTA